MQTESPLTARALDKMRRVSGTRSTVLLTGETGTGKSFLARQLHSHSSRSDRQFVVVHCGAIPDTLIESELFGHEKGAFTGAVRRKQGKFEIAHGGTIFLDEVGTITPAAQIKLLNVLQDRSFQRVGGETTIESDVRVIAATNENLSALCAEGKFRQDLFYRLNVFPIHIPPLRDRLEDLPVLVDSFIQKFSLSMGKEITSVNDRVMDALLGYDWPGNVRELENVIERACILEETEIITPPSIPAEFFSPDHGSLLHAPDTDLPIAEARRLAVDVFEKAYLEHLLRECSGVIKTAAQKAGVTPRQLHKLLTRHGMDKTAFKDR